jgi:epoxyqueuosine reductase
VVALLYHQRPPNNAADDRAPRGRVAMYAWGDDYHDVVKAKLLTLVDRMRTELDEPFEARVCVDTVPVVERELAAAAGIGWIGKNTIVLEHTLGSYFFLGELVTTLELAPDTPIADHCGTCTACLEACPTNAFPAPYEMDASRCISYLTIEHRGDIPESLQPDMENWIFGCDICQQVCPYNRDAPEGREPRFAIREPGPQPLLDDVLRWSIDDYRKHLRGSAMKRAKFDMLQRNARLARANAERKRERRGADQTAENAESADDG